MWNAGGGLCEGGGGSVMTEALGLWSLAFGLGSLNFLAVFLKKMTNDI